ncbi:AT hook motif protein [Cellulosimicrobium composti]|uniref:AT hook motif protein n=1 Tax=Cellulosimicrobium composti TaxID=2672572 RepID=UPI0012BA5D81|nr:AT hook motif protein [Cellulosimicrobium composti]
MTAAGPTPPDERDAPGDGEQPSPGRGVPTAGNAPGGEATAQGERPASGERPAAGTGRAQRPQRKSVLLRLDPAVHDALARWAGDDLRSVNAQIEMLLRRALDDAGRLPRDVRPPRRPGRPPRT